MNPVSISIVCLALSQVQPSQFDPTRPAAPIRSEYQLDDGVPQPPGGSFRIGDEESDGYSPSFQEPATAPQALRPGRAWDTQEVPQSRAMPANAQAPIIPVHSTNSEALAAMILESAMNMRVDNGTDVALVDVLSRVPDRASRQRAIQTYWKLSLALAERNFARHEARYLAELAQPQSELDSLVLSADIADAEVRQATADLNVVELSELLVEVGRLDLPESPRPVDRPFVGQYHTDFQKLFANRPAPRRLQQINRRLPHELSVIEARAEAVAARERAATELAREYANGSVNLNFVLESLTKLSRHRRELLEIVLRYNEQITEYSLAVVRPDVKVETLLGTLIRRDNAARPTMVADSGIRRVSAEAPILEPGEVDGSLPLRPEFDPRTSSIDDPGAVSPGTRSILKRVTIDHP